MDSVSDEALQKQKEIVVHAYTDGRAPGLKSTRLRIGSCGISCAWNK
ncbi:hypothetical protein Q5M85_11235 [Paraclostridium bifermentans]|nr:hypothetical protein [Paraclostridium bifermentans]